MEGEEKGNGEEDLHQNLEEPLRWVLHHMMLLNADS